MKKNEKGFGGIETLLILVIISAIGAIGWYVWSQRKPNKAESQITSTQSQTATETLELSPAEDYQEDEKTCTPVTQKGWVTKQDQASGISYAVDSSWPDDTKVTAYKVDEDIPMGYGAPVTVRFNSSSRTWEEYELDEKRTNYNTKDASVKVSNSLPTAILETGDGPAGEIRILFAKGSQVFQLELPSVVNCSPNPYHAYVNHVINSIVTK